MALMADREHRIGSAQTPDGHWFDPRQRLPKLLPYPADQNSLRHDASFRVLQDSREWLWIGSLYGLDRFDSESGGRSSLCEQSASRAADLKTVHSIAEELVQGILCYWRWGSGHRPE